MADKKDNKTLESVCAHIHNFFEHEAFIGSFEVNGGTIDIAYMKPQEGQWVKIAGSVFNDGIYQYPLKDLHDEASFDGCITLLAIPKGLEIIADEVASWQEKRDADDAQDIVSESFGGYSYSKATNSTGAPLRWQDVFKAELNRYRKLPLC